MKGLHLIGTETVATIRLGREIDYEMEIPRSPGAYFRSKVDRQRSEDAVARLEGCYGPVIQVADGNRVDLAVT